MIPYRIQDADLLIPPEWQDQSMTIFRLPGGNGVKDASFVITRDHSKGKLDLAAYIAKQIEECKTKLPGFRIQKNETFAFQEHAGAWLEYFWKNGNTPMLLRQVFYERGESVLICTLTLAPSDLDHFDPVWRTVMSGMKLLPLPQPVADNAPVFPPVKE